jgi:hypothetical protein
VPSPVREHRTRRGQQSTTSPEGDNLIMGESMMESQVFSPAQYSLSPVDLIPPDDDNDEEVDVRWLHYCEVAATLDREAIIDVVLDELRESSDSTGFSGKTSTY